MTTTDDTSVGTTGIDELPPIDPRIRQRRVAIRRTEGRRRLRWLVGLVAAVVVVVAGWGLLHSGLFDARVVTVAGAHPHTPGAVIVATAGLDGHPPLISVDPGAAAARVETLPFIASARVQRHWPDGVTVTVSERVPVAAMAGPGSSWSILDKDGRTLQVVATSPPGLMVLAVHSAGGTVSPSPVGRTLPAGARDGLTVARTLPRAFSAQVVSVTEAADGTIDLGLNSGLTVVLGTDTDLASKYEDVAAIIAHGSLQGAHTIDVSVPASPAVS